MRTPEAIAERAALYDRLEAELVEQEPVRLPKPAAVARCEAELIATEKRVGDAEAALSPPLS